MERETVQKKTLRDGHEPAWSLNVVIFICQLFVTVYMLDHVIFPFVVWDVPKQIPINCVDMAVSFYLSFNLDS